LKTIRELGHIETRILDIGCGSGAIAVSLLHSAPRELQCTAVALDISDVAVRLTRENADRYGRRMAYTYLFVCENKFCGPQPRRFAQARGAPLLNRELPSPAAPL
jgi:methylase of polypeptide subunit release factors